MVQDEKQKKLSKPEPDGLKPKEIQWKKKLQSEKQKKIHQTLNPTAFNQRQLNGKTRFKSKNQKNPLKPKPDDNKRKAIKCKNKSKKKIHESLNPTALN